MEKKFIDPAKIFYQWSGWGSYIFLLGGLVLPSGKYFGLLALLFGILHLSVFIFFDYYFDWTFMLLDLGKKPYIYAGIFSLGLMIILGIFSLKTRFYWFLKIFVWLAIISSLVHIVMIQKVISWKIVIVIGISVSILSFKLKKLHKHK